MKKSLTAATDQIILSFAALNRAADYLEAVGLERGSKFLRTSARKASDGSPITGQDRKLAETLIARARKGYDSLSTETKGLAPDPN